MDWRIASLCVLILWGVYSIFGAKAGEIHGEKVSMVFETAGFILLTLLVAGNAIGDFQRVTIKSFVCASLMGLMSAGGFYFLLYALRVAPQNLGIIIVATGLYPVVTVVVTHFLGQHLAPHQWFGVALAGAGLILATWK